MSTQGFDDVVSLPPFIGRTDELLSFSRLCQHCTAEGLFGMLFWGPPGIGKSRMLMEIEREAERKGVTSVRLVLRRGDLREARFFWRQIITSLNDRFGEQELSDSAEDFEALLWRLRRRSRCEPLLLIIDNLHVAQGPLLHDFLTLFDTLAEQAVVVICAYQDVPAVRRPPFLPFLSELRKHPRVLRFPLKHFTREEGAEMWQSILGVSPDPALLEELMERTGGNPLFIREIALLLRQSSRAVPCAEEDFWERMVPHAIHTTISRRLSYLSLQALTLLRQASLHGERFRTDELYATSAPELASEHDYHHSIQEAVAYGLLVREPTEDHWSFSHPVIHSAVKVAIPPAERRRLALAMARKAEAHSAFSVEQWADKLSVWWREGLGETARRKYRHYNVKAAEQEIARGEHLRAITRLASLVDESAFDIRSAEEAYIIYLLGKARHFAGFDSQALRALDACFRYYKSSSDIGGMLRVAMIPTYMGLEEPMLLDYFRQLLEFQPLPPQTEAQVLAAYGTALLNSINDARRSEQLLDRALKLADAYGDLHSRCRALLPLSYIRHIHGRFPEALEMLDQASDLERRAPDPYAELIIIYARKSIYMALGELSKAKYDLEGLLEHAELHKEQYDIAPFFTLCARIMMLSGEWEPAQDFLRRGLEEYPGNMRILWTWVRILDQLGDLEKADYYRGRLFELRVYSPLQRHLSNYYSASVAVTRALSCGSSSGLRCWLPALQNIAKSTSLHPFLLMRAHMLLCMLAYLLAEPALARAHKAPLSRTGPFYLLRPHYRLRALALAEHVLGQQQAASEYFSRALHHACACGDRPMQAWLLYETAHTEFHLGRRDTALQLRTRALELAESLQLVPLQHNIRALSPGTGYASADGPFFHFHLSPRETEVLRLIALGFTNCAIAETLHISVHTVANHIRSIIEKSGAVNRAGAVAAARRMGLLSD